jgi:hypothetical protein
VVRTSRYRSLSRSRSYYHPFRRRTQRWSAPNSTVGAEARRLLATSLLHLLDRPILGHRRRGLLRLIGGPDLSSQPKVRGTAPDIQLRYGTNYSFRVRLADHTGGGPTLAGAPAIPGPSPIANIAFRRWIRLMSPALITLPSSELRGNPDFDRPPTFLELKRPS